MKGETAVTKLVTDPLFKKSQNLCDNFYEVGRHQERLGEAWPPHTELGFFVLQYAKLRMLQFYYDFLLEYLPREKFELMHMDTDSLYIALSEESLEAAIKPHMVSAYVNSVRKRCVDLPSVPVSTDCWFPRKCCKKHEKHDLYTPGLFKVEFQGHEMVGLCSKTYAGQNADSVKYSCKGINTRLGGEEDIVGKYR